MKGKRRILFCILLQAVTATIQAQFEAQFSQYWAATDFYNPGYAGQGDQLNVTGMYSMQLVGYENAPKTMLLTAEMPYSFLGLNHGLGATFYKDQIGMFAAQTFGAQYAYKLPLWGGKLSIGMQVGTTSLTFDPSNINLGESNTTDPAFPTSSVSGNGYDGNLGIYYTHPLFYGGFSATHLLSPTIKMGSDYEMKFNRIYYFTGGCNIKSPNPLFTLQPALLLKSDLVATKLDITVRILYDNLFYGGVSYSPSNSVTFSVGGSYKKVSIGYAYELFTNNIGVGNGTHDLFISYTHPLKKSGKSKNAHKSIRIL